MVIYSLPIVHTDWNQGFFLRQYSELEVAEWVFTKSQNDFIHWFMGFLK